MQIRRSMSSWVLATAAIGFAIGSCLLLSAASGQEAAEPSYAEMPVDPEQGKQASRIKDLLKQQKLSPEDEKRVRDFYAKFALARWTLKDNLAKLTETPPRGYRRELRLDLTNPTLPKGETHASLNRIVLEILKEMSTGNYHPIARFNAMLAIGELNLVEPTAVDPAKPLPEAAPVLIAALTSKEQIDAVRVAALTGLLRHVKAKTILPEDANYPGLLAACVDLVGASAPPSGRTLDGHNWLRGQAADVLAELANPGPKGSVAVALGKLVGESGTSLSPRRAAARALGKMNLSAASLADAGQLVTALARFAADAGGEETALKPSRRRLKERLLAAKDALTAVAGAVSDPAGKQLLATVRPAVDAAFDATDSSDQVAAEAGGQLRAKIVPLLK